MADITHDRQGPALPVKRFLSKTLQNDIQEIKPIPVRTEPQNCQTAILLRTGEPKWIDDKALTKPYHVDFLPSFGTDTTLGPT
jgi:hypothetical protein